MKNNNFKFYIFHFTFYILSAAGGQENPPKCEQNLYIPNEPNFKMSQLTVTLDMIGTYNEN